MKPSQIFALFVFYTQIFRMNKLCVDETDLAGCETLKQIETVAMFVPVCSRPLANSPVIKVAAGPDHSIFVTGCHTLQLCCIAPIPCRKPFTTSV